MGKNEIIPYERKLPAKAKSNGKQMPAVIIPITYEYLSNNHYAFHYDVFDDMSMKMEESDQNYNRSEFQGTKFDDTIKVSEHIYYRAAAASGFLTSSMDSLGITDTVLDNVAQWNEKSRYWSKLIISAAKICGYKKDDYKGAAAFLREKINLDFVRKGITTELALAPNAAGLIFSIIGQYTRKRIALDKDGRICILPVPDYYVIGRSNEHKIIIGVLYWAFHMAIDKGRQRFDDLPKVIRDLLGQMIKMPIMNDMPASTEDCEKLFSDLLRKLFKENDFTVEDEDVDLEKYKRQIASVLLNEFITRGLFFVIKVWEKMQKEQIRKVEDIKTLNLDEAFPFNNRIVSRMCLISSGVYVAVNVAGAICKALFKKKANGRGFADNFVSEINIAGIMRFTFAIAQDIKYWGEDIEIFFNRILQEKQSGKSQQINEDAEQIFARLTLSPEQTKILFSLENFAIEKDIRATRDKSFEKANEKAEWQSVWKEKIFELLNVDEKFFYKDEDAIYRNLIKLSYNHEEDKTWVYLLALELALFRPYFAVGTVKDKEYLKLKYENDYAKKVFALRQTVVSESMLEDFKNEYKKMKGIVDGGNARKMAKVGAIAVVGIAAGGAALMFAPQIAVALVGAQFAELHGAALISASLALLGGGSLAAGGFGMAGGAALIAGGGAVLGLAGASAASVLVTINMTSIEDWEKQTAKLLTFADRIYLQEMNDSQTVHDIQNQIKESIRAIKENVVILEADKCDLDKKSIENSNALIKVLERADKEFGKMLK